MRIRYKLLFLLIMISCSTAEEETIPENILRPEKFTAVMIDVQITEGMRAQGIDIVFKGDSTIGPYEQIFDKHTITKEVFEVSYDYYLERPGQMELIYEQVLDSLSKLDAQVKQRFSAERKARLDSAKQAN